MATKRQTVKAISMSEFGGPEMLQLQKDVPVPVPEENQVLIKVHACGVNPADTYIRAGTYSEAQVLPYIPGTDVAGEIQSVGTSVDTFKAAMATGRNMMRAVRVFEFGGPEVLKVQTDVSLPVPKENQVLIKVHACGVNPVDTYIRSGTYARKPNLPYTPGIDVSGVVHEVGKKVTSFKKGDRVFTLDTDSGGYAEYTVATVDSVFPLSDKLDFKQGAAIGVPYFTAYHALFQKGSAKAGETVLVHGASGGVGIAACQLARAYGLKVLGTAGTEEGMKLVLKSGAHTVFNHKMENYIAQIEEKAAVQNINLIVEMLADINLNYDLKLLSSGGRVMIVGCRGVIQINPRETMAKETSIRGVSLFSSTKEEMKQCAAAILAGTEAGWLKPFVGREYPLEKVAEAQKDIIHSQGALGKMVLVV